LVMQSQARWIDAKLYLAAWKMIGA
jgi:hypothetical protein